MSSKLHSLDPRATFHDFSSIYDSLFLANDRSCFEKLLLPLHRGILKHVYCHGKRFFFILCSLTIQIRVLEQTLNDETSFKDISLLIYVY